MSALQAANEYFNAWNAKDAEAILASLSPNGTYADPITGGPISGNALKEYVQALWSAFPDLKFEIRSAAEIGDGKVAAEWIMRGTNHGPFQGLPPTGKSVETTGADFIETEDGKVTSVVGYFDGGSVPRQLGLQVVVQPEAIGPFRFGVSAAVQTGKADVPAAFSITQLQAPDEEQAQHVRDYSRQILTELMETPGFIGAVTSRTGLRLVTISAWSDKDAPAKFMRKGAHGSAMKTFFGGSIASSAYTSVWTLDRVSPYWVRCDACGSMIDPQKHRATCTCGAQMPDHPPYW